MKCHNLKSSIHVSFGKMRYPVGHNSNKMIHSILDHLNFNDQLLTRRFVINKTLFSLKTHIVSFFSKLANTNQPLHLKSSSQSRISPFINASQTKMCLLVSCPQMFGNRLCFKLGAQNISRIYFRFPCLIMMLTTHFPLMSTTLFVPKLTSI